MSRRLICLAGLGLLLLAAFLSTGIARAEEAGVPPKLIASRMVQPVYPEAEKAAGIEGMVLLNVEIKSDGTVGKVSPKEEVEGHPAFTASAMAAVQKWYFEPAQKNGKAVKCEIVIPIRFALK